MGTTHLKALAAIRGARVAAVFSPFESELTGDLTSGLGNLGAPAERLDLGDAARYREMDALFADPAIDAVDICLPTYLHVAAAIAALRAGKHVLVEKPLALDAAAAHRVVDEAEKQGRILMCAHVLRFWPAYVAMREAALSRGLGTMRFGLFRRRCAVPAWSEWLRDPARSGGVFDLLIHDVDWCLHQFGKPAAVSACGYSGPAVGLDCLDAQLFYEQGAVISVTGGWHHAGAYPFSMEFTVSYDGGTVEYSSAGRAPALYAPGCAAELLDVPESDPYAAEIEYFVECCRTGRQPELCPPRQSAEAVRLMLDLLESRRRGGERIACNR